MDFLIYNPQGEISSSFSIDDEISYIDGRVSKGKKGYYKGVGNIYKGQFIFKDDTNINQYQIVQEWNPIYETLEVINPNFLNKTGIFEERYQPQFTDYIGSCGMKEMRMVDNNKDFLLSSIDILDIISINPSEQDTMKKQFYFKLNYKCDRKKFLETSNVYLLTTLMQYMMDSDWNFPWDKNSISDISINGTITDIADLYKSNDIKHKLGTIYSIMSSLFAASPDKYMEFMFANGLSQGYLVDQIRAMLIKL